MMFHESFSDFIFQAVILGQPLFWMWIYDTDKIVIRERFRWNFYFISACVFSLIQKTGFSVGFYTNSLLLQYTAFTMLAVYLFNTRYDIKKSISLGFLTVFLNSYYWEIPLHLAEILSGTIHIGMVVQLWRLIPVRFLLKRYKFKPEDTALLSLGLSFSVLIMIIVVFTDMRGLMLYPVNRFVSLCILIKVLIEAQPYQGIDEKIDIGVEK